MCCHTRINQRRQPHLLRSKTGRAGGYVMFLRAAVAQENIATPRRKDIVKNSPAASRGVLRNALIRATELMPAGDELGGLFKFRPRLGD